MSDAIFPNNYQLSRRQRSEYLYYQRNIPDWNCSRHAGLSPNLMLKPSPYWGEKCREILWHNVYNQIRSMCPIRLGKKCSLLLKKKMNQLHILLRNFVARRLSGAAYSTHPVFSITRRRSSVVSNLKNKVCLAETYRETWSWSCDFGREALDAYIPTSPSHFKILANLIWLAAVTTRPNATNLPRATSSCYRPPEVPWFFSYLHRTESFWNIRVPFLANLPL